MTTKEKVAYLKGLIEGIDLDKNPKELKLFSAIIDVLDSLAEDVCEIEDTVSDMSEDLEDVSDDLDCLGEYIFGEDDEDYEDDYDDEYDEPVFYQVTCPACENTITIDEDVLMTGAISCPNCGETLEFDLGSIKDIEDEDVNSDKAVPEPIAVDLDEDIDDLPF